MLKPLHLSSVIVFTAGNPRKEEKKVKKQPRTAEKERGSVPQMGKEIIPSVRERNLNNDDDDGPG